VKLEKGSEEADMTRQQTVLGRSKSIAGTALALIGLVILYEKMAGGIDGLRHLLGANGSQALGVLPAVILAVSQVLQAHATDYQRFVQCCLGHLLLSSWPLLLVRVGTVLSRDRSTNSVNVLSENKDRGFVDLSVRRSTLR
jgi:hypothetical protein